MYFCKLPSVREKGITLVEAMIVVAIVGILLGLAVPSFRGTINSHRARTWTTQLQTDMVFARQEAHRLNMNVTLCASNDGATCVVGGTEWGNGWIVFSQRVFSRTVTTDPATRQGILLARQDLPSGNKLRMVGNANFGNIVTYLPSGFGLTDVDARANMVRPNATLTAVLSICAGLGDQNSQASARGLRINAGGSVRVTKPVTFNCTL